MRQMPFILVGLLIILCMGAPKAQAILYPPKKKRSSLPSLGLRRFVWKKFIFTQSSSSG